MAWSDAARRAALEARRRKRLYKPKNKSRLFAVDRVQRGIERSRHYEDRLEYAPEDLSSMYSLDRAQGRLLYRRLQAPTRKAIADAKKRGRY